MSNLSTICVIDDDKIYQLTFKKVVQATGFNHQILIFYNGEEAIIFLQNKANRPEELPDVIFLDINMPIMDGWDFMEEYIQIKPRIGKQISIYMVSSSVDVRDLERAKAIAEISDYLIKPVTKEQLIQILGLAMN